MCRYPSSRSERTRNGAIRRILAPVESGGIVALLVALLTCAAPAFAQQAPTAKPPVAPVPKLRVLLDLAGGSFAIRAPDGTPAGFDVDLVRGLCVRLKAECAFEVVEWDDLRAELAAGRADIGAGGIEIPASIADKLVYSAPYGRIAVSLAVPRGTKIDVTPVGLKGKRIATQRGTRNARWLAELADVRLLSFETPEEAVAALVDGAADGYLDDRPTVAAWLKTPQGACCELAKPDVRDIRATGPGVALALKPDDAKLKDAVDKALAGLQADGTIPRLASRLLGFPFP